MNNFRQDVTNIKQSSHRKILNIHLFHPNKKEEMKIPDCRIVVLRTHCQQHRQHPAPTMRTSVDMNATTNTMN